MDTIDKECSSFERSPKIQARTKFFRLTSGKTDNEECSGESSPRLLSPKQFDLSCFINSSNEGSNHEIEDTGEQSPNSPKDDHMKSKLFITDQIFQDWNNNQNAISK